MEKVLSIGIKRGFSNEKLKKIKEPKVKEDEGGYYIYTVNENVKVYFEDFYTFLEEVERRGLSELRSLREKIASCDPKCEETSAYYCARKIIVEVILKNLYGYYGDDSTLGVIMSPWCFGTVVLEKVENYKERLSQGELPDVNLPECPYLVLRYIDEIYKETLLEIFELPPEAFSLKWQYAELLKHFARVLSNIHANLSNILSLVQEHRQNSSDQLA
jgi:hypothetical protein